MTANPSVLLVIPARYGSTRFPGKPLADIAGKSLVHRVWERCAASSYGEHIVVATDDDRIREAVTAFGGTAVMTAPDAASGTERAAEVARTVPAGIVVNVQGDEPLLAPATIDAVVAPLLDDTAIDLATAAAPLTGEADLADPNVVKAVVARDGRALYFSRAAVPHRRNSPEDASSAPLRRHIGIYAFHRDALLRFAAAPPSPLERIEGLEQLRALELGLRVTVVDVTDDAIAVDVPGDVARVAAELARRGWT